MTSPRHALRDLKIGVRLAAAFAACGLLVGLAAYLGLSAPVSYTHLTLPTIYSV